MEKHRVIGLAVIALVAVVGLLFVTQGRRPAPQPGSSATPAKSVASPGAQAAPATSSDSPTGPQQGPTADSATPPNGTGSSTATGDQFARARFNMVLNQIQARGVKDQAVLEAMLQVRRDQFVLPEYLPQAHNDHPLPIGYGQTISQPYIVALMTEALKIKPGDRVLEIGTGSGYQAAVLAEMGAEVYTVEIIPELAGQAEKRLRDLGYGAIHVLSADGYFGWQEHAPYDAIIVTAAPDHLPPLLSQQLRDGGRLVIPIGPMGAFQTLWLFEKRGADLQATNLGGVSFVPLTGTSQETQ